MDDVVKKLNMMNEEVWLLCGMYREQMESLFLCVNADFFSGSLSKSVEEYEKSFSCFERVLQYNQNNVNALMNLGNLYMNNGNYQNVCFFVCLC